MTHDISTDNAHVLRLLVEKAYKDSPERKSELLHDLEPICSEEERIVTTVGTFRDFHESSDEETREVLDTISDEELEQWVPDLYNAWASQCHSAAEELVYAAKKKENA